MALRVVTPPVGTWLDLAQIKAHLRVDYDDDDDLIMGYLKAAQRLIEGETQRRYLAQNLEWVLDNWHDPMPLPIAGPVGFDDISVPQISYTALDGSTQVLDPSIYWVRPAGQTVKIVKRWFVIWPWLGDGAERVTIEIAIAGDGTNIPDAALHAARLLVSHWYQNRDAVVGVDNRDSSTELPLGVEALLTSERWD